MKILVVASWFPSPESPVSGIFVAEQASALAACHDVTVLTPAVTHRDSVRTRSEEAAGTYRVIRTCLPAVRHLHSLRYAWEVIQEIRSGDYDLVHAHVTLPGGLGAVLAGIATRRPSVITEHMGPFANLMGSRRDRAKVRFALNHASAVIAVSQGLQSQMRASGITRPMLVVPNLIDTQRFSPRPKPARHSGTFQILFVGRLNDRQKNLPSLLRAMAQLRSADGPRFFLRIIGDGGLRPEYERLAQGLGIDARCEFLGTRDAEGVARALADCDVFVLPSLYENCPVVVAEAMAAGRPVIVTQCGGSEEMVTPESGLAVPVGDADALAAAIRAVCGNLEDYPPEKIAGYAHSRFGAPVVVGRLTEIYESLLIHSAAEPRAARVRVA
jgi:L-malate glycosyltransferase